MKRERNGVGKVARRILAGVVSLALALTLMPAIAQPETAKAEGTGTTSTTLPDAEGLELNKNIQLQADGTYKITMEAFATGETEVIPHSEAEPLDIVLVLDQSGSMSFNFGTGTTVTGYEAVDYNVETLFNRQTNLFYKDGDAYYPIEITRRKVQSGRNSYWAYTISYQKNGVTTTLGTDYRANNTPEGFYQETTEVVQKKRLDALMDAVDTFVKAVKQESIDKSVNHRIAIAGFASDGYNNTEILTGCTVATNGTTNLQNNARKYYPKGYGCNGVQFNSASRTYQSACATALQDVSNGTEYSNIQTAIGYLTAHGGTRTDQGMQMARDILQARTTTTFRTAAGETKARKKVVVVFTDGIPTSGNSFEYSVANDAIAAAQKMKGTSTESSDEEKANSASIYTIGIFDGANATTTLVADTNNPSENAMNGSYDWGESWNGLADREKANETNMANKFMHYLSSNYLSASSMTSGGSRQTGTSYYKTAANVDDLKSVFTSIASSINNSSTTVALDDTSILKDTISQYFDIADVSKINAYTVDGTIGTEENAEIVWGTTKTTIASGNISLTGKTIEVTGFNYKTNYVAPNHPGKKLVVEAIVTANELAAGAGEVPSNVGPIGDLTSNPDDAPGAGVYAVSGEEEKIESIAEYFPVPTVVIPANAYVLDFGKTVSIAKSEYAGISQFIGMSSNMKSHSTAAITGTYGNTNLNPASNKAYSYTPTTFKWNGIDKVYGFGTLTDTTEAAYQWYQTKFIPATSVYYEDDFGTASNDSSVNIIYTGSWTTDGTAKSGEQSYKSVTDTNADNYGWDDVYAKDDKYSGGTAHTVNGQDSYDVNGACATAEFTFTGSAVDIYSRTNMTTGQIMVVASKIDGDNEVEKVFNIVDGLLESGDFYQIPTVALDLKEYGTYKVTITVSTDVTEKVTQKRSNYYLDGIRVYNPMGIGGGEAADAYAADNESNPYAIEFRDLLLSEEDAEAALWRTDLANGAVFIDEIKVQTRTDGSLTLDAEGLKTFRNYGPKNEVYLAPGQTVAFMVNKELLNETGTTNTKVMVGIKAPEGASKVDYTNGKEIASTEVKSATDMYYEVTPDENGCVVITNSSTDKMLALTKIKVTNVTDAFNPISFTMANETLRDYVANFGSKNVVEKNDAGEKAAAYTGEVIVENSGAKAAAADTTAAIKTSVWKALVKNVESFLGI